MFDKYWRKNIYLRNKYAHLENVKDSHRKGKIRIIELETDIGLFKH